MRQIGCQGRKEELINTVRWGLNWFERSLIFSEGIASGLQGKREEAMARWKSGKLQKVGSWVQFPVLPLFFHGHIDKWEWRVRVWLETGCQDRREELINRPRVRICLSTWKRIFQHVKMWERILLQQQNLHFAVDQFLSMFDWQECRC